MLNIPAGWKLVPIEPTETMVVCGFESRPDPVFSKPEDWEAFDAMTGCQQAAHKARLCYAAMLDAAPTPPSVAPGDAQKVYHFEQRSRFGPWIEVEKPTAKSVEFVKRSAAPAAGDALTDPALQMLFGEAITGALAFGAQGVNQPPVGHWLEPFWNMARADAGLAYGLALLDHPLLRDVLGYVEDAGPADVWGAAQSWMALRDAALAAQVPQQGEA